MPLPGQTVPNKIAYLIDCSGSMNARQKDCNLSGIEYAKLSLNAFIGLMNSGGGWGAQVIDQFSIIKFNRRAQYLFPSNGTWASAATDKVAATQAVDTLSAGGSTNMKDSFVKANALYEPNVTNGTFSETDSQGLDIQPFFLILSDGNWNTGRNPLQEREKYNFDYQDGNGLGAIYLYVCQSGRYNQPRLDAVINDRGSYVTADVACEMPKMLHQTMAMIQGANLVIDEIVPVRNSEVARAATSVPPGIAGMKVSVIWDDLNAKYTADNPKSQQIQIRLKGQGANGSVVYEPTVISKGHAAFEIASPIPGNWEVQINGCGVLAKTKATIGAFLYPDKSATIVINSPSSIVAGEKLPIEASLTNVDSANNLEVEAIISKPAYSIEEAAKVNSSAIKGVIPTGVAKSESFSGNTEAKLVTVDRANAVKGGASVMPATNIIADLKKKSGTTFSTIIDDTTANGVYHIHLKASWLDAKSKLPVSISKNYAVTVSPKK